MLMTEMDINDRVAEILETESDVVKAMVRIVGELGGSKATQMLVRMKLEQSIKSGTSAAPASTDRRPHRERSSRQEERRPRSKPSRPSQTTCKITAEELEEVVIKYADLVMNAEAFVQLIGDPQEVKKVVENYEKAEGYQAKPGWENKVLNMFRRLTNLLTNRNGKRDAFLADEEVSRNKLRFALNRMFHDDEAGEGQESNQAPAEQEPATEESSDEASEAKNDEDADEDVDEKSDEDDEENDEDEKLFT